MSRLLSVALLAAVAAGGALAWVRLAPSDPAVWHVDPLTRPTTGRPNEARVMPEGPADFVSAVYPQAPEALMARLDAAALAEPRTTRLAGEPSEGFVTWVQRSATVGFPDYVSARAVPVAGGAALAVWSRSRFGYSDLGVNRARIARWLAALDRAQG